MAKGLDVVIRAMREENPDLAVDTTRQSIRESAATLIEYIEDKTKPQ